MFLYITPHSSHPPGLMKSLVFVLLRTYYLQNTHCKDFYNMMQLLFTRLLERGHQESILRKFFLEAVQNLEDLSNPTVDQNKRLLKDTPSNNNIYFHIPFHPRDISCKKIRDIHERVCESQPIQLGKTSNICTMTNPNAS